ncbi:Site-specific recombinase, phageintegrase family [Pseudomonas caricapapayae]|uniref:Site-specific recombinase, phageintegrase family n=1 Tax=Pseudomonas caricapapayae TaxID=46678 RepID=A0A3M6ELE3_9PSED|nr:integrase [Pseudomonas caricapapayae]RMV68374.1 Site-specific recombinase, phageintegrase family [Pseudomonas caricapapayae]
MKRGRKRRDNPNIPSHIDQSSLPRNVYFDHRGSGCWYTLYFNEAGRRRRTNLCASNVTLSELHRLIEERNGVDRDSLHYLCNEFHKSQQYNDLAKKTQDDYCYSRNVLLSFPTKLDKPLGELAVRKFTPALIQRVIDKIAEGGTPSKAAHGLRYLRRVLQWGRNRGFVTENPARGIEAPKERKQRRLPDSTIMTSLIRFAQQQGQLKRGEKGACSPYLWYVMEIGYLCRLRAIETITLTDENELEEGVLTNRRKGSRDNIVRWTPRLRAAWDAAKAVRSDTWHRLKKPVPFRAEQRFLIVSATGCQLSKSGLDTAFQRLITQAIEKSLLTEEQRFGLHDFKRKGITDTVGNRAEKQQASGHKDESMMDVYDLSLPVVNPSGE